MTYQKQGNGGFANDIVYASRLYSLQGCCAIDGDINMVTYRADNESVYEVSILVGDVPAVVEHALREMTSWGLLLSCFVGLCGLTGRLSFAGRGEIR